MAEGFPNPYEEPRTESPGEAAYRVGSWLLIILRLFGGANSYQGKKYEDAAALLARPLLLRYSFLRTWKAPMK